MGGGRWSDSDWSGYATTSGYASKTVDEIYSSRSLDKDLDPKGIKVRESRDSKDNPNSTALIIGLDVTGSMGRVLDVMARKGLNTLATEIYNRKPVSDPHLMCMGIGDAEAGDSAPLQVTQFEADIRIAQQLEKIWLEKGGGGNNYESYALAWYFAAMFTSIDCFEKRNKKGYIFTIGDEEPTPYLRSKDIERVLGSAPQSDLKIVDILTMASKQWEIFHVIVEEGDHCSRRKDRTFGAWADVLGQKAIHLSDHTKLAETIISVLQINEGHAVDEVVKSWDGSTSLVVGHAVNAMVASPKNASSGLVQL